MKASQSLPRGAAVLLPLLLLVLGVPSRARADVLYASSISGGNVGGVYSVDTQSNAVNQVFGGVAVDSLIFDSQNRIIYTAVNLGEIQRYDPATHTTVTLATGLSSAGDLTLEPGGGSVLASSRGNGTIYRLDLSNNTLTPFHTGTRPDGLVYDTQGRLFAVLNRDTVVQLNPLNGAILHTSPVLAGGLDGLTFDSFSGKLFVAAEDSNGDGIYAIDPDNLASDTPLFFGSIPGADGITSDAMGNIFIAAFNNSHIYQYNIPSGTLTERTLVTGLDDLAPLSGLGSPAVPEPSTLALFGMGIIGLLCLARRANRTGVRAA